MKAVELLGPSGAGKTFLYDRLMGIQNPRNYLSVKEASIKAAKAIPIGRLEMPMYLFSFCLKFGLFSSKSFGLARTLLKEKNFLADRASDFSISSAMLDDYLKNEPDPVIIAKRIENFNRCANLLLTLDRYVGSDDIVFFDEGVLHYHHGLNVSSANSFTEKELSKDHCLNPYAVVSCNLSLKVLLERVKNRRAQGVLTFSHGNLSEAALEEYVAENYAAYQLKIDFLKSRNVPMLEIQTDDKVADNIRAIGEFMDKLD